MKKGDKVRVVSVEKRLTCPNDGPLYTGTDDLVGEVVVPNLKDDASCTTCCHIFHSCPYVVLSYVKDGRTELTSFPEQDLEVIQ